MAKLFGELNPLFEIIHREKSTRMRLWWDMAWKASLLVLLYSDGAASKPLYIPIHESLRYFIVNIFNSCRR
jgi:hypothetical protein